MSDAGVGASTDSAAGKGARPGRAWTVCAMMIAAMFLSESPAVAQAPQPGQQVILVTGSTDGLGRVVALRLARTGAHVIVHGRNRERGNAVVAEIQQEGQGSARFYAADFGSMDQVREFAETILRDYDRLDVLVNNAGTTEFIEHTHLDELTEEIWDRILRTNLKGPFFCVRAAVPLLRKAAPAAIVNISSVAGISGEGSSIAYAASKGALNTMTRSLARALAPEIRVNAVCPGPVDTRWLRAVMTEEELQQRTAGFPLQRPATPDDIADAVLYLATGTTLTTGQCLVVDGGRTM